MFKRAGEIFRSDPKRMRKQLTHGPLDKSFGQHSAFPPPDSPLPLWDYLADVRREAEFDRVCHFVPRVSERGGGEARVSTASLRLGAGGDSVGNAISNDTDPGACLIDSEYVRKILDRLMAAKSEFAECGVEISVDFDVTNTCEPEGYEGEGIEIEEMEEMEEMEEGIEGHESEVSESQPLVYPESLSKPPSVTTSPFIIPPSAAKWREAVFSSPPPPQHLFQQSLDHPTVIKLIVYYTRWLLASMPPCVEQWIWATFVRLDNGLDHCEIAIVRDLGRKASKLRLKAVAAQNSYPTVYDVILAVVGDYYGQKDLLK